MRIAGTGFAYKSRLSPGPLLAAPSTLNLRFRDSFQITARAVALAAQKVASLFGQNRITSHRMGDAYREASSVATDRDQKERDEGHNRNRKGGGR